MKIPVFAAVLLTAISFSSQAQAQFWVCPVHEVMEVGGGLSEYWCDECPDSGGYYLLESNRPYGSCFDPTKTGCFTIGPAARQAQAVAKVAEGGLSEYLRKDPKPKNGARIESSRVVSWNSRKFKLFVISKGKNVGGVGYEIAPDSRANATQLERSQMRRLTTNVFELKLAGIRYRLVAKGAR